MPHSTFPFDILRYVTQEEHESQEDEIKLPPMDDLARKLGISRGKLREEMIAAQAYGVVEMRPGDGTYVLPFDFYTGVRTLILYGIARDRTKFDRVYRLRVQLEIAFWEQAVRNLEQQDMERLRQILQRADQRLKGTPVEIPHEEHREFHLALFGKLDNEFVTGLLQAYWDAYEAVGLNRYFEYSYFEKMWSSHRAIVEAIAAGQSEQGREILVQHFTLLQDRLQKSRGKH